MRFGEIYRTLCQTWREQSRKVRICAARYYAGVDSLEQLKALGEPQHIDGDYHVGPPILTQREIDLIIRMR